MNFLVALAGVLFIAAALIGAIDGASQSLILAYAFIGAANLCFASL